MATFLRRSGAKVLDVNNIVFKLTEKGDEPLTCEDLLALVS